MLWWGLLALVLLVAALRLRRSTGLGWRRVVYSDTRAWQSTPEPLIAREYGLVGKPDYIVRRGRHLVPVEVKPGRRARTPYDSDLMQLAAYCLLMEATTGKRPPFGILRYADATFEIPFDDRRRRELLDTLAAMHADMTSEYVPRSHDEPGRCGGCGFAERCEESLA